MLLPTTQALHAVQQRLHGLRGLHSIRMSTLRTPDGFSAELKRDMAMQLRRAEFEAWRYQQFLPTEAANDPQPLPGAA